MRAYHLACGVVSMVLDRGRFRRPRLGDAALAVLAAESVWLARRCVARGAYDEQTVAIVDTATTCVGLFACALALRPDEQFAPVNWMFPVSLLTTISVSSGFESRVRTGAAVGMIAGTYATATASQASGGRGAILFGLSEYAGCFMGGDTLVGAIRRSAAQIEAARRDALEQAERVAEARERSRLQRELHQGALRALMDMRAELRTDRSAARRVAQREAIRLRRALHGELRVDESNLVLRVDELVRDLAQSGLRVELVVDEVEHEPSAERVAVMIEALDLVLRDVVDYADTKTAIVRLVDSSDAIELTVRDHGVRTEHTELPTSLQTVITELGGEVQWRSRPSRGTRVVLRVPH